MTRIRTKILTLVSGTSLASLISLALTPIVASTYGVENYGAGELINLVSGVVALISVLRLDSALVIAKDKNEVNQITSSVFTLNISISTFAVVLVNFFPGYQKFSIVIGLSSFFIMLFDLHLWRLTREMRYRAIAIFKVMLTLTLVLVKIGLGLISPSSINLAYATLIAYSVCAISLMSFYHIKVSPLHFHFSLKTTSFTLRRFSQFPLAIFPINFLNSFREMLLNLIVLKFFGPESVSYFTLAAKILRAPSMLFGNAVSTVLYEAIHSHTSGHNKVYLLKKFIMFAGSGLIALCLALVFSPLVIDVLLPKEWEGLFDYLLILSPIYFFYFINATIDKVCVLFQMEKLNFKLSFLGDLLAFGMLYLTLMKNLTEMQSLITFSIFYSVARLTYYWRFSKHTSSSDDR